MRNVVIGGTKVLVSAVPHEGEAWSCAVPGPPCAAAWTARAVFVGTVRHVEVVATPGARGGVSESKVMTFDVARGFVNAAPGPLEVVTSAWGGVAVDVGRTDLVYASSSDGGTPLVASRCSRTQLLEEAMTVLASDPRYNLRQGNYSPNGRWIVFVVGHRHQPGRSEIAVMPSAGGQPDAWTFVTGSAGWADKPRWSPDDLTLYFSKAAPAAGSCWAPANYRSPQLV